MAEAVLIERFEGCDPRLLQEWDHLAAESGLPLLQPGWLRCWWNHAPPATAQRVVAVLERGRLIGLAPFYAERHGPLRVDYRIPDVQFGTGLAPLAIAGREEEVAVAVAEALQRVSPRPDVLAFESLPADTGWDRLIAAGWPGSARPLRAVYIRHSGPSVELAEGFDSWFASRSQKFRENRRRRLRRLAELGGQIRAATPETVEADLAALFELHARRWGPRGGSRLLRKGDAGRAILAEAAATLLPQGRLRVWVIEDERERIWVDCFLAAGATCYALAHGWEERFGRLAPPVLGLLHCLEEMSSRGERVLEFGVGAHAYATSMANRNRELVWAVVAPPRPRLPLTGLRLAPVVGRNLAKSWLDRRWGGSSR
jgi:CelD/BcsL family acetyltransferase involved in cellulose biosynthesis